VALVVKLGGDPDTALFGAYRHSLEDGPVPEYPGRRHRRGLTDRSTRSQASDRTSAMPNDAAVRFMREVTLREAREQLAPDDLLLRVLEASFAFVDVPRLLNLRERCLSAPPGAFVECGVAQGASLAVMAAYADGRRVWGFDSFEAFPMLSAADEGSGAELVGYSCSGDEGELAVVKTFAQVGVSMTDVHLVKGWFSDTLPETALGPIAVLRLDADFYEATKCALDQLYPSVVRGGYVIIDDYATFTGCRRAVDEYRELHAIDSPLQVTDPNSEVWWSVRS
jgi:hypothetical protein